MVRPVDRSTALTLVSALVNSTASYWCIGTGASCIYPLLGATINGWSFLATEILPDSVKCAGENVARNSLEEKVSG